MRGRDHARYWDDQPPGYDARIERIERRFLASSRRWVCLRAHGRMLERALRVLSPGGDLLLADHARSHLRPLRAVQHLVYLFTVPLQGEHCAPRPLDHLRADGVSVVATERLSMGIIERVHARPGPAATS